MRGLDPPFQIHKMIPGKMTKSLKAKPQRAIIASRHEGEWKMGNQSKTERFTRVLTTSPTTSRVSSRDRTIESAADRSSNPRRHRDLCSLGWVVLQLKIIVSPLIITARTRQRLRKVTVGHCATLPSRRTHIDVNIAVVNDRSEHGHQAVEALLERLAVAQMNRFRALLLNDHARAVPRMHLRGGRERGVIIIS